MKVKMKEVYSGPLGCAQAGQIVDVTAQEAQDLIDEGLAASVPAEEPKAAPASKEFDS